MQRTTALKEASSTRPSVLAGKVRVEIWVTELIGSLVYRMLVLNTGQVPWELSRQLETVYRQLLKKISAALSEDEIQIFLKDDQRRRADAGQYQSSTIVELFLIFSSRKDEVEIRDRVAEDFARLDTIETSSHADFVDYFVEMLKNLASLNKAFSRLERGSDTELSRFDAEKDIFASLPALAGFAAAVAVYVFDEPGFDIDWKAAPKRLVEVRKAIGRLADKMEDAKIPQLREFMQLDLLNQRLSGRRGGVGRFERELFKRAFTMMIRNADRLRTLEPCWRAG